MFLNPVYLGVDSLLNLAAPFWAGFVPSVVTPSAVRALVRHGFLCLEALETLVRVVIAAADAAARTVLALAPTVAESLALVAPERFRGVGAYVKSSPYL